MRGLLDKALGVPENSRTSTKYTMRAGWFLILSIVGVTFFGVYIGIITDANIISLVWAYLITAAAMFGINMTRVTVENVKEKSVKIAETKAQEQAQEPE